MGGRRLLLIPYWLWLLLLVLGPFVIVFVVSFCARSPLGQVETAFQFDAYREITEGVFVQTALRTFLMALANTFFTLLCAYPLAYGIARQKGSKQVLFLSLVLIPFWTNYLIRVLAFMDFLRLDFFGINLLFTPTGVLGALVYTYVPFALLPLYASMRTLDFAHLEAARDLGASSFQVLWHVLLPLTSGGIRNAALFIFVPSLGEYLIPELVGGGKFYMLGSLLQHQFTTARNWPAGAALIVLLLIFLFALFAVLNRSGLLKPGGMHA